jgi:hypothetical protein
MVYRYGTLYSTIDFMYWRGISCTVYGAVEFLFVPYKACMDGGRGGSEYHWGPPPPPTRVRQVTLRKKNKLYVLGGP